MAQQLNIDFYRVRVLRLSHDLRWEQIQPAQGDPPGPQRRRGEAAKKIMSDHLRMIIVEKDALMAEYPEYFVES